jgi:hypothetical protein
MIFVMTPVAFGQVNLTIQYSGSPREIQTNRTAYTADPDSSAALTVIAARASTSLGITATTLIIDYPSVLTTGRATSSGVAPAGFVGPFGNFGGGFAASGEATPITLQITSASGMFAGTSAPVITTVNYSTGQVYILLPFLGATGAGQGGAVTTETGGSFRLENARIDANGVTAPAAATATLASTAAGYQIVSGTSGNVIDAVSAGIASVDTGTTPNTAVLNIGVTSPADATFTVRIQEGFASAWYNDGLSDFFDQTNTRDTELRLTFTGIPAGVTITLTGSAMSGGGTPSFSPTTVTSADNVSTVTWTAGGGQLSRTEQQRLTVTGTISTLSSSTAAALTAGSISLTVSMAPVGSGNIAATTSTPMLPDTTLTVPRFAAAEVGPITVVTITAAKTTFLIPYAVSIPSIFYDTGIAIANTSKDPFGSTGGASASQGNLTFHFFPRTATGAGTSLSYTTSATNQTGAGLDASGNVVSGGTWSGLLSEVWTKAGGTGDFTGYIFIEANFLLGHGVAYVSTFRGDFTSATPVLELVAPAVTARGGSNALLTY